MDKQQIDSLRVAMAIEDPDRRAAHLEATVKRILDAIRRQEEEDAAVKRIFAEFYRRTWNPSEHVG
jgi:hypothetical protein